MEWPLVRVYSLPLICFAQTKSPAASTLDINIASPAPVLRRLTPGPGSASKVPVVNIPVEYTLPKSSTATALPHPPHPEEVPPICFAHLKLRGWACTDGRARSKRNMKNIPLILTFYG